MNGHTFAAMLQADGHAMLGPRGSSLSPKHPTLSSPHTAAVSFLLVVFVYMTLTQVGGVPVRVWMLLPVRLTLLHWWAQSSSFPLGDIWGENLILLWGHTEAGSTSHFLQVLCCLYTAIYNHLPQL